MILFAYILVSVLGLAVVFFLVSYISSYWRLLEGEAPYVPVSVSAIPEVIKVLGIKKNSIVYDLGCGDGRVLFAGHKFQPKATYIGLEKNIAIFLYAWIRTMKIKKPRRVKIFKRDFLFEDISKATHIFAYLMPRMMEKLTPKFERELAPGARVVSCDFPIRTREPVGVIEVENEEYKPLCKLFVYDF
jgi:SAM-dependent methyltransferase